MKAKYRNKIGKKERKTKQTITPQQKAPTTLP